MGLTEAYLAVEDLDTRAVSAVARQIMFNPEPGYNFGYRDSSEESGPVRRNCPARILDLLTPTSSKYAQEWRADCRERIEARRYASTLREGTPLRFCAPLAFTVGEERVSLDTFTLHREGRTVRFRHPSHPGTLFRIPDWEIRPYDLAGAASGSPAGGSLQLSLLDSPPEDSAASAVALL